MPLFLDTGYATKAVKHGFNADACQSVVPEPNQMDLHGALFAIANGLAGYAAPEQSARAAVTELSNSYYTAHEGWTLKHALLESLMVANQAVRSGANGAGAAAISGLVLRGRRWVAGHAGNTRVSLFRDNRLKVLTRDHVEPRPRGNPLVERACGLSESFEPEFASGELSEGDVFVLTSDGVHGVLDGAMIMGCLHEDYSASQMADSLMRRAQESGSRDDVTACVVRVEQLPPETNADLEEAVAALPLVSPPAVGETIDGFYIERLIHKSRRYRLYKAIDRQNDTPVALKFPNPRYGDQPEFASSFLHEEWVGRRINSSYLVRFLPLRPGRRTALYSVMAYHRAENLESRIRRKQGLSTRESLFLMNELLAALDDLHARGVVHRDVRPKNLVLDKNSKQLMLIGLGSSHIANLWESEEDPVATFADLNYLAPEVLEGGAATAKSDIFAAGVTLYHMLTVQYPYGKIRSPNSAYFDNFIPASRQKPELPLWLDEILRQACHRRAAERFASAEEFSDAIDEARTRSRAESQKTPAPKPSRLPGWAVVGAAVVGLLVYLVYALR